MTIEARRTATMPPLLEQRIERLLALLCRPVHQIRQALAGDRVGALEQSAQLGVDDVGHARRDGAAEAGHAVVGLDLHKHRTRALKQFIGLTPAQILDRSRDVQLSFLYKTAPLR